MSLDGAAEGRAGSLQGRLARLGFADAALAVRLLSDPGLVGLGTDAVVDLSLAADPDLALGTLSRIADTGDPAARALVAELDEDEETRRRVLTVLGASVALGDHLVRHPRDWTVLRQREEDEPAFAPLDAVRAELLRAVGADPADPLPKANGAGTDVLAALRVAYRRRLLAIAASDLADGAPFVEVAAALADLADATLEAALAVARAEHPDAADLVRLAVIALGKCGGRELNYISDVDVVYVVEAREGVDENDAVRAGTRLAQSLMRACNAPTPEGSIWEVDPNLRPERNDGALVRTLADARHHEGSLATPWHASRCADHGIARLLEITRSVDLGRVQCETGAIRGAAWQAADGLAADGARTRSPIARLEDLMDASATSAQLAWSASIAALAALRACVSAHERQQSRLLALIVRAELALDDACSESGDRLLLVRRTRVALAEWIARGALGEIDEQTIDGFDEDELARSLLWYPTARESPELRALVAARRTRIQRISHVQA